MTFLQDMTCDILNEPSPLGLRLKKSPSLVDLIQMKLSQAKSTTGLSIFETPKKKEVESPALTTGELLKASNFPADVLKIGTWEVRKVMFPVFQKHTYFLFIM
jgi:hypothetical protein